jgi:hypothetical protein
MARKRSSKKSLPLDETLAQSSREELIEIIKAVIKRDPTMKELVDLAMAAPKPGKPMNVSTYRQQARRTMETESLEAIENGLMNLRDVAARLAKSGDWLNAGAIYHVALDEAVAHYDDLVRSMDRDGDISVVMDDLAEGLGDACCGQTQRNVECDPRLAGIILDHLLKGQMMFHRLPTSEWRVIDRRDVREEGAFDSLPARLFVRFADGRAGAHQPIPVQCDILAGVLFTVRLQPGHVLRPFDSDGCLICISLALFRRRLIQLGLFGQKSSQFQLLSRRQRGKLFFQLVELFVRHLFTLG